MQVAYCTYIHGVYSSVCSSIWHFYGVAIQACCKPGLVTTVCFSINRRDTLLDKYYWYYCGSYIVWALRLLELVKMYKL